jgi:cell wall-associated NlpC family hydrolase
MRRTWLRAGVLAVGLLMISPIAALAYDGTAAATYADTYWSTYNRSYPSFANSGGDCTNYVSQALAAGGISMRKAPSYSGTNAWFMLQTRGRYSYSTTWVNAQDNSTFLSHLPGVTMVASVTGATPGQVVASNASQGDVVFYDWNNDGIYDHEAIVVTADGQRVDAHTNNRYHEYWTLAQFNGQYKTTRITVFHIPATVK